MSIIRIDTPPKAAQPARSPERIAVWFVATSAFLFLAAITLFEIAPWSVAPLKEGTVTIQCAAGGPAPPAVITAARATLLSDATIAAASNSFVDAAIAGDLSTDSGTELARQIRNSLRVDLTAAGSASRELLTVHYKGRLPEGLDLLEHLARTVARELPNRLKREASSQMAALRASRRRTQREIAAIGAKLDACHSEITNLHASLRDARRDAWRRANASEDSAADAAAATADNDHLARRDGAASKLVTLLIDRSAHLAEMGAASRRLQRLEAQVPSAEAALRDLPRLRLSATPVQESLRQAWRGHLSFALALAVAICGGLWCSLDAAQSAGPSAEPSSAERGKSSYVPALHLGPHVGRELLSRMRSGGPHWRASRFAESSDEPSAIRSSQITSDT